MIPLMKNTFFREYETRKALSDFILQAGKLSMGERCVEFEKTFAKRQGRSQAVLFNSGGSANLALMQGLRNLGTLAQGEKVGFSALTWSTNVMPILQMGFAPVPVDCEPSALNVGAVQITLYVCHSPGFRAALASGMACLYRLPAMPFT